MTLTFDGTSREAGWAPFVEWLAEHGIKARDARAVSVDGEELTVSLIEREADGRPLMRDGEILTSPRRVSVLRPPPRRGSA